MEGVHARRAGFGHAKLDGASLIEAQLGEASLTGASLVGADLRMASLQRARASSADFARADLSRADLRQAELDGSSFHGANLERAQLAGAGLEGIRGFAKARWIGVDIHEIDFTGAHLCRRFILDQNYLEEFKQQGRFSLWAYRLWWVTSDCGRSFVRWGLWTLAIAAVFGAVYTQVRVDYGDYHTPLSPLYYSVVTLTTLGYGDIVPASRAGQVVVIAEAITAIAEGREPAQKTRTLCVECSRKKDAMLVPSRDFVAGGVQAAHEMETIDPETVLEGAVMPW